MNLSNWKAMEREILATRKLLATAITEFERLTAANATLQEKAPSPEEPVLATTRQTPPRRRAERKKKATKKAGKRAR